MGFFDIIHDLHQNAVNLIGFSPIYILIAVPITWFIISTIAMYKQIPIDRTTNEPPPVIGRPTILPWLLPGSRAQIASLIRTETWTTLGYEKYSRKGDPYTIHTTDGIITIVPAKYIDEVKLADHHELTSYLPEAVSADIVMSPRIMHNVYHADVIRKALTTKLNTLTPDIAEEVDISMKRYFDKHITNPDPKGWNKIHFFPSMLKVIAQSSLRVFVGKLAREEGFQDACISYATSVFPESMLLKLLPKYMQHVLAPVICFSSRRAMAKVSRYLRPLIAERIAMVNKGVPESEQPNDFLQWLIQEAPNQPKTEQTIDAIALRLLITSFAALHTTAMSMTNLVYDLAYLSSQAEPGEKTIIEVLREEVLTVLPYPHTFDKRTMQTLYKMDAFMKETLRLHLSTSVSFLRQARRPEGWTTSDGRLHFPQGALLALPNSGIAYDGDVYNNPEKHDFTRFYRGHLQDETQNEKSQNTTGTGRQLDRYIVTTSNEYLVFGHGKHACPGRFFAANEMRILLSYFLINYDIKPISDRPKDSFITYQRIVDMDAILDIRKRVPQSA